MTHYLVFSCAPQADEGLLYYRRKIQNLRMLVAQVEIKSIPFEPFTVFCTVNGVLAAAFAGR